MRDILIVEDGLYERERLEKLFSNAGYSVSSAEGVEEAQAILHSERFRLAVLDVGLGDKSGSYLFDFIKRSDLVTFVIIFTGNPSVHLKQRFLEEGAVSYVVKGSPEAENSSLLGSIQSLLGNANSYAVSDSDGATEQPHVAEIDLSVFLASYVSPATQGLFYDSGNCFPPCAGCGAVNYVVTFHHKTQLPPIIDGMVICAACRRAMDPELG